VERRYPAEEESYHLPKSTKGATHSRTHDPAAVSFDPSQLRRKA
jgi:hypothetical protein